MISPPKTLEEARKHRYHPWAGNSRGYPYREGDCAWQVWDPGPGIHAHQCSRKNGYGSAGLYCKQHAKKVEVEK